MQETSMFTVSLVPITDDMMQKVADRVGQPFEAIKAYRDDVRGPRNAELDAAFLFFGVGMLKVTQ